MAKTYNSISRVRKSYPYKKPSVSTGTATNITATTVTLNGNVTAQGSTEVTVRGFCYSLTTTPTTSNSIITSGVGTGSYSANLTGLTSGTTYYVRAYATNSIGTSYGSQKTVQMSASGTPIVTTATASGIFKTTAVSGGEVTSIGGSAVTERGVCYGTTSNPTISGSKVASGTGIGSFTANLTGLTPQTNYYIRAYATNTQGTTYGNQTTITTQSVPLIDFGLYIDDFGDILGQSSPTTVLLNFLNVKQVTQPIFYLASLLDDSNNRTSMRAINTSLVTQGITNKAANVTQAVNVVNLADAGSIASFNENSNAAQKFTTVVEEIEFYKTNPYVDSFAEYVANCDEIKEWADANGVTYQSYYARCRDVAGVATDTQIAAYMVETFETLKLVDYVSTSKFNQYNGFSPSIKAEIQLIANAAFEQGKVQNMELIFASQGNIVNGTPTNMRTFFQANPTLLPAYNQAISEYNRWSFANKEFINLQGMTIYALEGVADL